MSEIHIFTGHYGSGKTEVSVNFALAQKKAGKRVAIIDLDTVNPYFRTNDLRAILEDAGVEVIAGRYASTNVDMPILPADIFRAFDTEGCFIFDVGGDDEGAYALGQYAELFEKNGYQMHFVVNTKRPLTASAGDLLAMEQEIETASRLRFTDIYNNTNLAKETDASTLLSARRELSELEKESGLRIAKHCGVERALVDIEPELAFPMKIYLKMPF